MHRTAFFLAFTAGLTAIAAFALVAPRRQADRRRLQDAYEDGREDGRVAAGIERERVLIRDHVARAAIELGQALDIAAASPPTAGDAEVLRELDAIKGAIIQRMLQL